MTAFDTMFARAFRSLLAKHGESVTWMPRDGRSRTITVLVNRQPRQDLPPMRQAVAPMLQVEALDDHTDEDYGGIDPDTVKAGADKFRIAWEQGGELEERLVHKRIPSDGGVVRLEIR